MLAIREDSDYQQLVNIKPSPKPGGLLRMLLPSKTDEPTILIATAWALFQKPRLRRLIETFRKRLEHLQHILPHAIYSLLQQPKLRLSQKEKFIKDSIATPDGDRLGISKHAKIRGISTGSNVSEQPELELKNCYLETSPQSGMDVGLVRENLARGNVQEDPVLVEYKIYGPTITGKAVTSGQVHPNVLNLARVLYSSGSDCLGTLPLRGFTDQPSEGRYAFIFDFPLEASNSEPPESLNAVLSSGTGTPWRLGRRFDIAHTLARTIGSFHLDRWIHKNISSHSLVFFKCPEDEHLQDCHPYLVGFEFSRPDTASTMRHYDGDQLKNLYRHPRIQNQDRPTFTRLHDIYSLGIVLLEIAIWQTAQRIVESVIPDAHKRTPKAVQKLYVEVAKREIPHRMDNWYLSAVLACLTPKFERQFQHAGFPRVFQQEVIENLDPEKLKV